MPRAGRAPSFQFYPADFLADPAVSCMEPAAVGGYMLLLCYAFGEKSPGTLPLDEDRLARLSRLNGSWPTYRDQILAAFEVRDGLLIQKRMVQDHAASARRHQQAVAGGRETQKLLRAKRMTSTAPATHGATPPAHTPSEEPVPPPRISNQDLQLTSPAPTPSSSSSRKPRDSVRQELADWKHAFEDLFWPKYRVHRPDGKQGALDVWMKVSPKSQETFDLIDAGLDRAIANWKKNGTEAQYIPHARTWLHQQRYRD